MIGKIKQINFLESLISFIFSSEAKSFNLSNTKTKMPELKNAPVKSLVFKNEGWMNLKQVLNNQFYLVVAIMISDLEISSEFKPNQSINPKLIVIPDKLRYAIKYIADT